MTASVGSGDFVAEIAAERAAVDAAMERAAEAVSRAAPDRLRAAIGYALDSTGKRLRPIMCVAAYRAAGGGDPSDDVYDIAAAVEVVHTYSLMHDDLPCMDDDDLRRGRPTTHTVHGLAAATLAGAALIPFACSWLAAAGMRLGEGPGVSARLVSELARGAGGGGMAGGQLMDLEAEGRGATAEQLEQIHARKTGALFAASLRIGGAAARASEEVVDALGRCGRALGLAFQITDDLLDEMGESAVLGKTAGRDRERSKATFPALLGVDGTRSRAERAAARAEAALAGVRITDPLLRYLVRLAVERDR